MKRNKLMIKSTAVGLAVAMAATTMSMPGGLMNPTEVYAEENEDAQVESVRLTLEPVQGIDGRIQKIKVKKINNSQRKQEQEKNKETIK